MLAHLKAAVSNFGVWEGLLYLLDRTLRHLSNEQAYIVRYGLFAQPVVGKAFSPDSKGRNIEIRNIESWDPVFASFPRPKSVIERHLTQGATCLVAQKEDALIGYIWLVEGQYEEDEVRCRFMPVPKSITAWDFDVYVVPSQRLGFAFLRLWDAANSYLQAKGIRWCMSRISAFNPRSIAAHRRLGAEKVGNATFVCIASMQLGIFGHWPFIDVSLRQDSRPELRVKAPDTID